MNQDSSLELHAGDALWVLSVVSYAFYWIAGTIQEPNASIHSWYGIFLVAFYAFDLLAVKPFWLFVWIWCLFRADGRTYFAWIQLVTQLIVVVPIVVPMLKESN